MQERGPHGLLQRAHRRRLDGVPARLPAAVPLFDGARRRPRRPLGRPRGAPPLPAFLYWLGPHIDALAPRRLQQVPSGGRWGRLAAWVMRRPGRRGGDLGLVPDPPRAPRPPRPLRRRRRDDAAASASHVRWPTRSSARLRGRYSPITALTAEPDAAAATARLAAARSRRAAAATSGRAGPLAARCAPEREGTLGERAAPRRHGTHGAPLGAGDGADRGLRRPTGIARGPPPVGARDPRADDLDPHLPLHRLRCAAAQVARHERADARRLVRRARRRVRVGPRPVGARVDPTDPPLRHRLRSVDRLCDLLFSRIREGRDRGLENRAGSRTASSAPVAWSSPPHCSSALRSRRSRPPASRSSRSSVSAPRSRSPLTRPSCVRSSSRA